MAGSRLCVARHRSGGSEQSGRPFSLELPDSFDNGDPEAASREVQKLSKTVRGQLEVWVVLMVKQEDLFRGAVSEECIKLPLFLGIQLEGRHQTRGNSKARGLFSSVRPVFKRKDREGKRNDWSGRYLNPDLQVAVHGDQRGQRTSATKSAGQAGGRKPVVTSVEQSKKCLLGRLWPWPTDENYRSLKRLASGCDSLPPLREAS